MSIVIHPAYILVLRSTVPYIRPLHSYTVILLSCVPTHRWRKGRTSGLFWKTQTNGGYKEERDCSISHWHKWQMSIISANPKSQSTIQCPCFLVRLRRATRVAYWKISRTPSPDLAEHSKYCLAPIFCATAIPYIL